MESWVGFARIPLSFSFRHMSYAVMGNNALLLSSTALNKPLPRTSFIRSGNFCWTATSCCLSSFPSWSDLYPISFMCENCLNPKTNRHFYMWLTYECKIDTSQQASRLLSHRVMQWQLHWPKGSLQRCWNNKLAMRITM